MSKIQVMNEDLANKIAAGEVWHIRYSFLDNVFCILLW